MSQDFAAATFREFGHILAYGILSALAWRADRRFTTALLITILVASTDEYRQSLTLSRTVRSAIAK
jgi:hypothetical protein